MKKLLWLSALVLSYCLAYGQVLNSVKPLGIPLGTDKATTLKAMQDLGGVIEQQAPEGNIIEYTLKQQFAGQDIDFVVISFEEQQLATVVIALPSIDLEAIVKHLKSEYGDPKKISPIIPIENYHWQIEDSKTKGLAMLMLLKEGGMVFDGKKHTLVSFGHHALSLKQLKREQEQALKKLNK